jgi:hypothetical protein
MPRGNCGDCKFAQGDGRGDLECHFNAPPPRHDMRDRTYWPYVDSADWCGQFAEAPAISNGER